MLHFSIALPRLCSPAAATAPTQPGFKPLPRCHVLSALPNKQATQVRKDLRALWLSTQHSIAAALPAPGAPRILTALRQLGTQRFDALSAIGLGACFGTGCVLWLKVGAMVGLAAMLPPAAFVLWRLLAPLPRIDMGTQTDLPANPIAVPANTRPNTPPPFAERPVVETALVPRTLQSPALSRTSTNSGAVSPQKWTQQAQRQQRRLDAWREQLAQMQGQLAQLHEQLAQQHDASEQQAQQHATLLTEQTHCIAALTQRLHAERASHAAAHTAQQQHVDQHAHRLQTAAVQKQLLQKRVAQQRDNIDVLQQSLLHEQQVHGALSLQNEMLTNSNKQMLRTQNKLQVALDRSERQNAEMQAELDLLHKESHRLRRKSQAVASV